MLNGFSMASMLKMITPDALGKILLSSLPPAYRKGFLTDLGKIEAMIGALEGQPLAYLYGLIDSDSLTDEKREVIGMLLRYMLSWPVEELGSILSRLAGDLFERWSDWNYQEDDPEENKTGVFLLVALSFWKERK